MAKTQLTKRDEEVLKRGLGKRPRSSDEVAKRMGANSSRGVSRNLGNLVKAGKAERVDGKGFRVKQ